MQEEKSQEEQVKKPAIIERTLAEQGPALPLGTMSQGIEPIRTLEFRSWTMKEEKVVGKLLEERGNLSMADYVSIVLSHMCLQLGQHKFDKNVSQEERIVKINQMGMGDVYYAYIWLRTQALGTELDMAVRCSTCKTQFDFTADLNTLKVQHAESFDDACFEYELKVPFEIRGQLATQVRVTPAPWNSVVTLAGDSNMDQGKLKAGLLSSAIQGINGNEDKIMLMEDEIDDMAKRDFEALTSQYMQRAIGPVMMLEGNCPEERCGAAFAQMLNWRYDYFFGDSSRAPQ